MALRVNRMTSGLRQLRRSWVSISWLLLLLLLLAEFKLVHCSSDGMAGDELKEVRAVLGQSVALPCRTSSNIEGDFPELVLWYRKDSHTPFFSVDIRGNKSHGIHTNSDGGVKGRNLTFLQRPGMISFLVIQQVVSTDAGVYKCRVDFVNSPTQHSLIKLSLIVPPSIPIIRLKGREEEVREIGPYREGDQLSLECVSKGGEPPPLLSWWQDGQLVSTTVSNQMYSGIVTSSYLDINAISRQNTEAPLECRAINNNISEPLSTRVHISAIFGPVHTRIVGSWTPFSLGHKRQVKCESKGSRPLAKITWWLGSQQLKMAIVEKADADVTVSTILLNVSQSWQDQRIFCRAKNPKQPELSQEDSKLIVVHYAPRVKLSLGKLMKSGNVKEGKDVYMECHVDAIPSVDTIVWKHNDVELNANTAGVVMSNMSLVLQQLKHSASGKYTCHVTNSEGQTTSNAVHLNVLYGARCLRDQKSVYRSNGVTDTRVICRVTSNPPRGIVTWKIRTSQGWIDADKSWYSPNITGVSELVIPAKVRIVQPTKNETKTPTENEKLRLYGELTCSVRNDVSQQTEPCHFTVLPPETDSTPSAPVLCRIHNRTSKSLHVRCQLTNTDESETTLTGVKRIRLYHLQAYRAKTHALLRNMTQEVPDFLVDSLPSAEELVVHIFVSLTTLSDEGVSVRHSDRVTLEAMTLRTAELKGAQDQSSSSLTTTAMLGALLGATMVLLLLTSVFLLCRRRSHHDPRPVHVSRSGGRAPGLFSCFWGGSGSSLKQDPHRVCRGPSSCSCEESEQRMLSAVDSAASEVAAGGSCHNGLLVGTASGLQLHPHSSPDVVPCKLVADCRFSSKAVSDCYTSGRSTPMSMLSVCDSIQINPENGLPRRLPPPLSLSNPHCSQHCQYSSQLPVCMSATLCRRPNLEVPASLIEQTGLLLPPATVVLSSLSPHPMAVPSGGLSSCASSLLLPTFDTSASVSEVGSDRQEKPWSESEV